ncbi:GNAT family N-acetyltransferase [Marinomonas pollencensis]|uniref:Phosphinothricin acetyltransferase n=1 Tax=Marinomonas pollencensis TaxID=491954 RepID=A0A3E0DNE6_9GAMM|nr:GNAT family N-acetyltransferase [Marinomonas pollencensis]REG84374.1 phosphinothricin acetyltransferase [Marinomonas pollencensis]
MEIRKIKFSDVEQITAIYNVYVDSTQVTFEEACITPDEMHERVEKVIKSDLPWLVLESEEGDVLGYAYASPWHHRSAYRFTVETTVYLMPEVQGQGYGTILYEALLALLHQQEIKSVIGVIALPNEASIALHEALGFEKVGEFADVGFKFEQWVSVGYWQLLLEQSD